MPKWMESIHKVKTRLEKIFLMKADDEQIQSFFCNFNGNQPSNDTALNNFRPNPQRISSRRSISTLNWLVFVWIMILHWWKREKKIESLEGNRTKNQFKETLPFSSYTTSNPSGKTFGSLKTSRIWPGLNSFGVIILFQATIIFCLKYCNSLLIGLLAFTFVPLWVFLNREIFVKLQYIKCPVRLPVTWDLSDFISYTNLFLLSSR